MGNNLLRFKNDFLSKSFSSLSLIDIIIEAKNGNEDAILFLLNKYNPLIMKYSSSYHLKNYDKEDLIQIGNIAVIKAIKKYDITKDENYIDAYFINSIKNTFRNLARSNIKYGSESSLNIPIDEDSDIESLIPDEFNLENFIVNTMENLFLKSILEALLPEQLELINAAYFTPNSSLFKYCKENNLNYPKKRRELIALLSKLRIILL